MLSPRVRVRALLRSRTSLFVGAGALAVLVAACSALFGDATQCSSDSDCSKFGNSVCSAEGVCVGSNGAAQDGGGVDGSGDDGSSPGDDGGNPGSDTGGPVVCLADAQRPLAAIPGNPIDAGAGAGPGLEITTDTHLTCDQDWALAGTLVVRAGATLTIDKSVVVRAQAGGAIVVQPGAKLVAVGTSTEPIVVTSAKAAGSRTPGDFKGVFLLGRSTGGRTIAVNGDPLYTFGGNDPADSSGTLKYVRVEYAVNALYFAGVGTGTSVEYVQARRTSDDAISFAAGTVNAKHLAVQAPGDEAFYVNNGFTGKLQFLIAQRTPGGPNHNGLMIEGSRPIVYNATLCGTNVLVTPNLGIGLLTRNNGRPDLHNSIVMGWAAGFDVVGDAGAGLEVATSQFFGQLVDNYAYAEDAGEVDDASPYFDDDNGFDEQAFLADGTRANAQTDPQISACFTPDNPSFGPKTTIAGATPPNDGFFDTTATYRGALKDANDAWVKQPWLVWATQ